MNRIPAFDLHGPLYLEAKRTAVQGAVALIGVPYDGTTSFRPGARFGPDALRAASIGIETYSPEQDADYCERGALVDLGNLELPSASPADVCGAVERAVCWAFDEGLIPLVLGGEHSITPGAVAAAKRRAPDLVVVQLDAHADLRPSYLGERYSHACAMRRTLEVVGDESLVQVGIRSGTREEFDELRQSQRYLHPEPEALEWRLRSLGDRPLYLTVDLDVFDPSSFPGTGTPEPGGIDWPLFAALLQAIPSERMIAADVVELAPNLDASGCSAVLAAKVVREVVLRLQLAPRA